MTRKTITMMPGYFDKAFNNPKQLIADIRTGMKGIKYDTLVGTGLSGALVIPMLARALRKNFLIVRKSDGSHSGNTAEGTLGTRWLFVDDFVSSGDTRRRVVEAVEALAHLRRFETTYVGTWQYAKAAPEHRYESP